MQNQSLPKTQTQPFNININPPLINTACPWATTYKDLKSLYDCPHTGAVTIRTSLWDGFAHDPAVHRFVFFEAGRGHVESSTPGSESSHDGNDADGGRDENPGQERRDETACLNTLGYSPIRFPEYVQMLTDMSVQGELWRRPVKPFIVSVTGSAEEVARCYERLCEVQNFALSSGHERGDGGVGEEDSIGYAGLQVMMEVNLSCPNIPSKPPPAYDGASLKEYISALASAEKRQRHSLTRPQKPRRVHVGLKMPPYTHSSQFETLMDALESVASTSTITSDKQTEECSIGDQVEDEDGYPISFITATNTLGSCLVLDGSESQDFFSSSTSMSSSTSTSTSTTNPHSPSQRYSLGGLSGAPLHTLPRHRPHAPLAPR